jgi:hypothetical protein
MGDRPQTQQLKKSSSAEETCGASASAIIDPALNECIKISHSFRKNAE